MPNIRIGMIVPSLNTIAEDDFRRFLPTAVGLHVHRVRLRAAPGPVTVADLRRTYHEAANDVGYLTDMRPTALAYNCTGVTVADGPDGDARLEADLAHRSGLPVSVTMMAIKRALRRLGVHSLVHVCPFDGESSEVERASVEGSGFEIVKSGCLGYADARVVAQLTPEAFAEIAIERDSDNAEAILLSCANARAMEAVPLVEERLGKPVIASNQAVLWDVARLAGWSGPITGLGRLGAT